MKGLSQEAARIEASGGFSDFERGRDPSLFFAQLKDDDRCDDGQAPQDLERFQDFAQDEIGCDTGHDGFPGSDDAGPGSSQPIDSFEVKPEGDQGCKDRNVKKSAPDLERIGCPEDFKRREGSPAKDPAKGKPVEDKRPGIVAF